MGQRHDMRDGAAATGAGASADACFVCALSGTRCDVAMVEGAIARVAVASSGRAAVVELCAADGALTRVALPRHAVALARALAAVPPEGRRGLTLRVFHLGHDTAGAAAGSRRLVASESAAVVLMPDLLLNITDINSAAYCPRHYLLRRMLPAPPTAAALRGTIIHQAFTEMLKSGEAAPMPSLRRALAGQAVDLALCQVSLAALTADAAPHLDALAAWQHTARNGLWGSAPSIRAETFLLAPEIGLKGRLDLLLEDTTGRALLELKTGDVHASLPRPAHRWQVQGYQSLLAVRRPGDAARPRATLLYSGTPGQAEGYGIPFSARELYRVLDLRNALALEAATGVAPAPPSQAKCGRCQLRLECARASCMLGWEPPVIEDQPEPVDPADARDFAHWYELLRLEGQAQEDTAARLWRISAERRRAEGSALGDLRLVGEPRRTPRGEWQYTFASDQATELREGDAVLLSDGDPVGGAVVSGTILGIERDQITIWTPERLDHPALLDRYSTETVQDRTVRNLWRWLDTDPRLRALVRGARAPEPVAAEACPAPEGLPASFNPEQREAVARALATRDVLLIQGPPGTGKTSVVAALARAAIARSERVLLAAFTNAAVDTVLRRLAADGWHDMVRLGHELSIAPELRRYRLAARAAAGDGEASSDGAGAGAEDASDTSGVAGEAPTDPALLRAALLRAPLVAATAATWSAERYDTAGEPLRFDLAIVDEASQLTVPAMLGALRFARRFVLVGDERQLPPLVASARAAAGGLGRSLFALLAERWGDAVLVRLRRQYRMHPVICAFPSAAFYGGALVAEGAARTATLPLALDPTHPYAAVLDPARPLVFVDLPEAGEAPVSKASEAQAEVVARLAGALIAGGVSAREIGVIAPYRAQVAAVRRRLAAAGMAEVVADTVDRFQGGERSVILLTFGGAGGAASAMPRVGSDFVADPHRLNVALTRARHKLILVGDQRRLRAEPLLRALLAHCAALYGGRGGIVRARLAAGGEGALPGMRCVGARIP